MGAIGGIFRDEFAGKAAKHFRGLRPKSYCIVVGKEVVKRLKGVKRSVVADSVRFEYYDKCLREGAIYHTRYSDINSCLHSVTTELVKKWPCLHLTTNELKYRATHFTGHLPGFTGILTIVFWRIVTQVVE